MSDLLAQAEALYPSYLVLEGACIYQTELLEKELANEWPEKILLEPKDINWNKNMVTIANLKHRIKFLERKFNVQS